MISALRALTIVFRRAAMFVLALFLTPNYRYSWSSSALYKDIEYASPFMIPHTKCHLSVLSRLCAMF